MATSSNEMPSDPVLCNVIGRMGGLDRLGEKTQRDMDFLFEKFKPLWLSEKDSGRLGIAHQREALSGEARRIGSVVPMALVPRKTV